MYAKMSREALFFFISLLTNDQKYAIILRGSKLGKTKPKGTVMIGTIIAGLILVCKLKLGLAVATIAAAKFFFVWSIVTTIVQVLLVGGILNLFALGVGLIFGLRVNPRAGILGFLGMSGLSLLGIIRTGIGGLVGIAGAGVLMGAVTIPTTGNPVWDKTRLIIAVIFLGVNLVMHHSLPLKITRSAPKPKPQEEDS
ncbi:MAG: hypothetical protein NTY61_01625 [Candidatus Parcubacteria bacterium]|nr:hypothetical protein [Candidatus Parcubacteria bacterium]